MSAGPSRRDRYGGFTHEAAASETVVWLTPPSLLQELGPFDLDPCAAVEQPWPSAKVHYTIHDDGLAQPWFGFVWCNPPWGVAHGVDKWLARMAEHGDGIALVPARTETNWFRDGVWSAADGALFTYGRMTFHYPDGAPADGAIGTPVCLVAYGPEAARRLKRTSTPGMFVNWRRRAAVRLAEAA